MAPRKPTDKGFDGRVNLRLPDELRGWFEENRRRGNRSRNQQAVLIIREAKEKEAATK